MNKSELIQKLEDSRERFVEALEDLPEEAYEQQVLADWTLKDLLSHMTRWEAETIKLLWQVRNAQRPTTVHFSGEGVDAINARWYDQARGRELERILEDFHATRPQTVRRLASFTEKELFTPNHFRNLKEHPLVNYVADDTYLHEDEHIEQVLALRTRLGNENDPK